MSGRILLIGGTGFLGSFVAELLAPRRPVALVRTGSNRGVLPPDLDVRVGSLETNLPLDEIETVVYCASMGFGHIPRFIEHCENAGVRRAIFVSTTAIFTSLPAASKALRLEAETCVEASELDWTILRPTMIYGTPRDRNISRLLRFLHRWRMFPLCGNALWQPVHVADVASAVVAALDTVSTTRKAYNIAGADALPFAELVRVAARAVNRRVVLLPLSVRLAVLGAKLTNVVKPEQIQRLAEDKAFPYDDATQDFGYAPRTFETGVREEARLLGLR